MMTTLNPIAGTPEGRTGIWLLSPTVARELVNHFPGERIHCFLGMIGANWAKIEVLEKLASPDVKIALVFEPNFTMGHHLVAIDEEHRWSFDIGPVSEGRMCEEKP